MNRKVTLSVLLDIVRIEIRCSDNYEAQVLYDDLMERMKSGEEFAISFGVEAGASASDASFSR